MDLIVTASVCSGSVQQIAEKEQYRQKEQDQRYVLGMQPLTRDKGCTGGCCMVESGTVLV